MRWVWIDKFTDFQSGERATAVKNVSLAEEHLHDHFPGWPVMPASLIVEGMAQTAGILVGEARKFEEKVADLRVCASLQANHLHHPEDQLFGVFEQYGPVLTETGRPRLIHRRGEEFDVKERV